MSGLYSGEVQRIIFQNLETSYYVMKMQVRPRHLKSSRSEVVAGCVVGTPVLPGLHLSFEANKVRHDRFGEQLQIVRAPLPVEEWTDDEIISLLESQGVGGMLLYAVRKAQAPQGLAKLFRDPEALKSVFPNDTAEALQRLWDGFIGVLDSHIYLQGLGLSPNQVRDLWDRFGVKAKEIIDTDPWKLSAMGVPFEQVNKIADSLGIEAGSPVRIAAAMVSYFRKLRSEGHLYTPPADLLLYARNIVGPDAGNVEFKEALRLLGESGRIVKSQDTQGNPILYEKFAYTSEAESARLLKSRLTTAVSSFSAPNVETFEEHVEWVREWAKPQRIMLTSGQAEGIAAALTKPVSILTGLPGTGKTTALRILVKILEDQGIAFALMAPTGIAAKRMENVTGAKATTIHRAFLAGVSRADTRTSTYLGIQGRRSQDEESDEDDGYGWSDMEPTIEVVIIDECSMLDQKLLYNILNHTSESCRLVFVGDAAQLPSVGPGRTLHEMISSKAFHVTDLQEIFRQQGTSNIVISSHNIHHGKLPVVGGEFEFITKDSDEEVLEVVLRESLQLHTSGANFQVLSPKHSGLLGVTELNRQLRQLLNPHNASSREVRIDGNNTIREGDRVMICRNDYQLEVFNGDLGTISSIIHGSTDTSIEVEVSGNPPQLIPMTKKKAVELLRLAYAITVHKSQGQEYGTIVLPWTVSMGRQLQRTLLYTAITRAKKRVIVVGHWKAMEMAIGNSSQTMRATILGHRIQMG